VVPQLRLLDKVKAPPERLWYAEQTIQNGWSRNVLVMQIESGLYRRQGSATTNFQTTLPSRTPISPSNSSKILTLSTS
jgi:predicted nuclease of restriction endonuclease-like (RecB) superfamily